MKSNGNNQFVNQIENAKARQFARDTSRILRLLGRWAVAGSRDPGHQLWLSASFRVNKPIPFLP